MSITTFFAHPSAWGIGLAIIFGAVWLASLAPLRWRSPWPWVVLLAGAILFSPSIAWIQAPLQNLIGTYLIGHIGVVTYQTWIFLTAIPVILLSGLIQEGAKLLPVAVYWWTQRRSLNPKLGLSIGAMAGAGFGVFEAQWALNAIFASGWKWGLFAAYGFSGIAGFWERFFTIAFHIASTALAGWGLAKGRGWQFYLLSAFLHFLVNYSILFSQNGQLSSNQLEFVIAAFAAILFGIVLWLRWRHPSLSAGVNQ